jgi:hypothetical protein
MKLTPKIIDLFIESMSQLFNYEIGDDYFWIESRFLDRHNDYINFYIENLSKDSIDLIIRIREEDSLFGVESTQELNKKLSEYNLKRDGENLYMNFEKTNDLSFQICSFLQNIILLNNWIQNEMESKPIFI